MVCVICISLPLGEKSMSRSVCGGGGVLGSVNIERVGNVK